MPRVTVFVPDDLRDAASHTIVLLSISEQLDAYDTAPQAAASDGTAGRISSGAWTDRQIAGVQHPEQFADVIAEIGAQFPDLDMALVAQAQAAFVLSDGPVEAKAGKITAIVGMEGLDALSAMGLTLIEVAA